MAELFILGLLAHLFADWFLQNDWQAQNKARWVGFRMEKTNWEVYAAHPAGYVHAGIHFLVTLLVFPLWAAAAVAITHWIIDLRFPLIWWRKQFRMTTDPDNPASLHVAIWQDQVSHILIIGLISFLLST